MSLNIITVTLNMGEYPAPWFLKPVGAVDALKNKISAQIPTEFARRFLQRNPESVCISKSNCDPFCIVIILSSTCHLHNFKDYIYDQRMRHCGQTYVKYMFSAYLHVDIINHMKSSLL